jgi:hypothetical protein
MIPTALIIIGGMTAVLADMSERTKLLTTNSRQK